MFEVYCHTAPDGKQYVGQTSNGWRARWVAHLSLAKNGSSAPLHAAIRQYGGHAFQHEVLGVFADESEAHAAEQHWIVARNTKTPNGYNATRGGEGTFPSSETCAKMRKTKRSPEERERARIAATGRKHSEESKTLMSVAKLGSTHSLETRAKLSEIGRGRPSPLRGIPAPAARNDKLSASMHAVCFKRAVKAAWRKAEMAF